MTTVLRFIRSKLLSVIRAFDLKKNTQAEFIPGMEATVELIGEKRTIAAYLMKPMDKMRGEAFREIG